MNKEVQKSPPKKESSKPNLAGAVLSQIKNKVIIKPNNSKNAEHQDQNFEIKKYRTVQLTSNTLSFTKLYGIPSIWKRYLIAAIASMFIAFFAFLFMQFTGIYSAGLSSFSQGFSRLAQVLMIKNGASVTQSETVFNIIFWMLFIVMNIPLAIFSYFKIGKRFTKLTIFGFLIGDMFGLGLSFIPNASQWTLIFGIPTSSFKPLSDNQVQVLFWTFQGGENGVNDLVRVIPLFLYSLIGSLIIPVFYSINYIIGGSTGGTDFISYYYSLKKHKPLGSIIAYFNTISLICGVFIGTYIPASVAKISPSDYGDVYQPWSFGLFLSPNLVASAVGSILMGFIINRFFPKQRMVKIKIYSFNVEKITSSLLAKNYPHTFTISDAKGAYSQKPTKTAESICQFIELPKVISQIKSTKQDCLIYVNVLNQVHGKMNILENID